MKSLAKIS